MEIEHTSAAKRADEGQDWRADVGAKVNSDRSVDLVRARDRGTAAEDLETPRRVSERPLPHVVKHQILLGARPRLDATPGGGTFLPKRLFRCGGKAGRVTCQQLRS